MNDSLNSFVSSKWSVFFRFDVSLRIPQICDPWSEWSIILTSSSKYKNARLSGSYEDLEAMIINMRQHIIKHSWQIITFSRWLIFAYAVKRVKKFIIDIWACWKKRKYRRKKSMLKWQLKQSQNSHEVWKKKYEKYLEELKLKANKCKFFW